MTTVLLTSVGRRVELVRAFQRAYQALGLRSAVVATDVDATAPALQFVDRPYLVPRIADPDYVPTLIEICRRESVEVVFPLIDPDVPRLAEARDALAAVGARVGTVAAPGAQVVGDKWKTFEFFQGLGIPSPRCWRSPSDVPPDAFPVFIKPRDGSAGEHAHRADDAAGLNYLAGRVPNPIVQDFLAGPEVTTDVVCDVDGTVLGVVSRQRLQVRGGEVSRGVTIKRTDVLDACVRIAEALPAGGPITVQCMLHDDAPYFTEINARFGGGIALSIAAGVDAPALLLRRWMGNGAATASLGSYQVGLTMARFDESVFLTEEQRGDAESRRLRSR